MGAAKDRHFWHWLKFSQKLFWLWEFWGGYLLGMQVLRHLNLWVHEIFATLPSKTSYQSFLNYINLTKKNLHSYTDQKKKSIQMWWLHTFDFYWYESKQRQKGILAALAYPNEKNDNGRTILFFHTTASSCVYETKRLN